jgi:hypothetical protein
MHAAVAIVAARAFVHGSRSDISVFARARLIPLIPFSPKARAIREILETT